MNPIVQLAITELPSMIAAFKSLFVSQNPTAPIPTDAEVVAAYVQAYGSSIAQDDAWLSAHPTA